MKPTTHAQTFTQKAALGSPYRRVTTLFTTLYRVTIFSAAVTLTLATLWWAIVMAVGLTGNIRTANQR